jgi:hypothetical protein
MTQEQTLLEQHQQQRSPLISLLVSQRQAADLAATRDQLDQFETIQTAHRNLKPLRTEEIYLFGISVSVGVGSLTIRCKDINLNLELAEEIERSDGSYIVKIPIFKALVKKGNKLATKRADIQRRFLRYASPYWYVTRADMPALRDAIAELLDSADRLRAEALDSYDQQFANYLEKLEQVLIKAGESDPQRIEYLLSLYSNKFPSRQDICACFGVTLEGPIKIPSLVEEAQNNADLAQALATEDKALLDQQTVENRRALQQREEQAIKEMQDYYIESLKESLAVGIRNAQDDAYGLIADMLSSIEKIDDPSRIRTSLKQRLDSKLQQLQTAINYIAACDTDTNLPQFYEQIRQIKVLTTSSVSPETLKATLETLRSRMCSEFEQVFSSSKTGHRALAQFLMFEEPEQPLEDQ